ncbi:MAG TPA: metal-dependent transcriptional regulator [Candidatus Ornithomonoglobus intestinigallinarum]|uniref:Metal-dependent transcriptional regulator n=1 Tax=Candidatus Ornithomonoglobus intestinigallinarum TaxID=2840894 RepID=A0A9D1H3Y6_9FIRM|nr:metal-dependent transcriptional regulator [Candidatus Ornithomonoglobus intestinigallinarum]
MKIHESAENYLETILMLKSRGPYVRAIDVAHELGFTKASVSVALKSLRAGGYITVDENDGNISLTDGGMAIAEKIYERHQVIAKLLMELGVSEKTAYEDSCKIEHDISSESFDMLKRYMIKNDLL